MHPTELNDVVTIRHLGIIVYQHIAPRPSLALNTSLNVFTGFAGEFGAATSKQSAKKSAKSKKAAKSKKSSKKAGEHS